MLPTKVEQELKALRKRNAKLERSLQILREARLLLATERDRVGRR